MGKLEEVGKRPRSDPRAAFSFLSCGGHERQNTHMADTTNAGLRTIEEELRRTQSYLNAFLLSFDQVIEDYRQGRLKDREFGQRLDSIGRFTERVQQQKAKLDEYFSRLDGLAGDRALDLDKARAEIRGRLARPEDSEFIFFVADGTGGHAFATNLNDHNANVAKWRKIERENNNN